MKAAKPFGTVFPSANANQLFRLALGDGYTTQQACAAIRNLIELECVVAPPLTLPVRIDPAADGGIMITDGTGAKFDGARVFLRHPGPEGLRLRTAEDRRIDELAEMLVADPLMDRDEAFNALADRHTGLTDLQFDHDWAAAHRQLQRTSKPGPKPGKPRKRQAVRRRTPRESRK
jgi:hypothetical protein